MRRIALIALIALSAGCTQNAFFELQIELPGAPAEDPESWYAQIQVRDQTGHAFDVNWMGGDLPTVPLTSAARWECISVQSLDASVSLNVRVRFCRDPRCLAFEDSTAPERLYSFETPFYVGARTYYRVQVPEIPRLIGDAACLHEGDKLPPIHFQRFDQFPVRQRVPIGGQPQLGGIING